MISSGAITRHSQPSGYAASRMSSSRGAWNGTGAPCKMAAASTGSLLLGNNLGIRLRSATPTVCGVPADMGFLLACRMA